MSQWQQANIAFPDWATAEQSALAHLAPLLAVAEADGLISAWFFIRKHPVWRIRYAPANEDTAQTSIQRRLDRLATLGYIADWTNGVYEPETHAFGGSEAMGAAHRFFDRDSNGCLAYLTRHDPAQADHRRELSLVLCTATFRAAGLDWYEQGDVWARVAAHRDQPTELQPEHVDRLRPAVRRLISVDAEPQLCPGSMLADIAGWADAYQIVGRELAALNANGRLHRGLRDVLAHHVIFAWNRLGLSYTVQATMAATAAAVVFGPDPTQA
jgi:thiopeptide-type bacteriocin biosynthesis protein